MTKGNKKLICSICSEPIQPHPISGWAFGNNAQPINAGRCCDLCDESVVIPHRINLLIKARKRQTVK